MVANLDQDSPGQIAHKYLVLRRKAGPLTWIRIGNTTLDRFVMEDSHSHYIADQVEMMFPEEPVHFRQGLNSNAVPYAGIYEHRAKVNFCACAMPPKHIPNQISLRCNAQIEMCAILNLHTILVPMGLKRTLQLCLAS